MNFLFPGRIILLALNLARPRPAASPGTPTRIARCMSGFCIRQVESKTLTYHERVGSGRTEGTQTEQFDTKTSKTRLLNVSLEA